MKDNFENSNSSGGIITKRKFTDILCALIFLCYLILLAVIAIWGYAKGDLDNVAQPYDGDKEKCGVGSRSDFRYLFIDKSVLIPDSTPSINDLLYKTICVKKCPSDKDEVVDCFPLKENLTNCSQLEVYKTYGLFGRICVPSAKDITDTVLSNIDLTYFEEALEEIQNAWPAFIVATFVSLIVCVIFYFLLQCCAGIIIWITIIGSVIGLAGFGGFSWVQRNRLNDLGDNDAGKRYEIIAICCWVGSGLFVLVALCLCSQINLAIKMIKGSAQFVRSRLTVFLVPIIHTFLVFIFIAWWLISFLMVFSVGEVVYNNNLFGKVVWEDQTKAFVGIMVFGCLWCVSFSLSSNIFVISAMAASFYFDPKKQGVNILRAFCWAYTYHLGTLAFGSCIIALIWFIQLILTYFYNKAKQIDKNNFCFKCLMCFVACFERFMRFVNKHAYMEVVIRNKNFCGAVWKTIGLLTGNFVRFGVLAGLVGLFLVMATIFITVIVTIIGYYIMQGLGEINNDTYTTVGPLVVIGLIAFVISIFFNYIFSVSADTMMHCLIYEEEMLGGVNGNCPEELKAFNEEKKMNVDN